MVAILFFVMIGIKKINSPLKTIRSQMMFATFFCERSSVIGSLSITIKRLTFHLSVKFNE